MNEERTKLHLAVIMDGNRRYAGREGMPVSEGHVRGYRKLRDVVSWSLASGVSHLTVYGFSTENWRRDEGEVSALMTLFALAIAEMVPELRRSGVRMRFIGDRARFPGPLVRAMKEAETATQSGDALVLTIALSYGARDEIVRAVRGLAEDEIPRIDEERFAARLDTRDLPDPDIVLRTGGERRLSNFLLWQSAYSELFFSDTLWPDLTEEEFATVLKEYHSRERRHGV